MGSSMRPAEPIGTLAVEIGGTFTDMIVSFRDGDQTHQRSLKVPSTPAHPEEGVMKGIQLLGLAMDTVADVLHGSTVGTNAVLERKGAATALLVTDGFRDILEIQRGDKRNIYDINYQRTRPLVPRDRVYSIPERLDAGGNVLLRLDEAAVAAAGQRIREAGIAAVAICFLHSYANPAHELRAKQLIGEAAPGVLVLTSSELLPQFREYERASTSVMSAYVSPIMASYVSGLSDRLRSEGFRGSMLITQSNGGVLPATAIEREVVRTLLSGPAAGVTGAVHVATSLGHDDIITLDMGGTSTDVCLIRGGAPLVSIANEIAGLPVAVPMIDINTVGAGGGSIAFVDAHGMLHVGPESAGADPGPAAYAKGGEHATVTDANIVRGVIRADSFAGGGFPLDRDAAEAAVAVLGRTLGLTTAEAAEAITRIVEANMMQAIRVVSTQRGYDPRDYVLVAFGGAGPMHAAGIAEEMGIETVVVPAGAGVLSAFGLLVADISRDYVQTRIALAEAAGPDVTQTEFARLIERARAEFEDYGYEPQELVLSRAVDVRYLGQAYELTLPVSPRCGGDEIATVFHDTHRKRYGFASPDEPVEIVNYRLKAVVPRPAMRRAPRSTEGDDAASELGEIVLRGRRVPCAYHKLERLPIGCEIDGPAVLEDPSSTCLVPPGWRATVQHDGSVELKRGERA
jgi:N-methylhydantoinase A